MKLLDDHYRLSIGKKLANCLGEAIERGEIENNEAANVCDMILNVAQEMQYQEQLDSLLQKLSAAWPFYRSICEENKKLTDSVTKLESMFENRNIQFVGKGQATP